MLGHTKVYLRDHMRCWGLNTGSPYARLAPSPLYYHQARLAFLAPNAPSVPCLSYCTCAPAANGSPESICKGKNMASYLQSWQPSSARQVGAKLKCHDLI